MSSKFIFIFFILVLSLSFISAVEINVPDNILETQPTGIAGVEIEIPKANLLNLSSTFVNVSQFANCWNTIEGVKCDVSDISTGELTDDNTYVNIIGDTMTGNLTNSEWFNGRFFTDQVSLRNDINISPFFWVVDIPTLNFQVVPKKYVDDATSSTAFDFFFNNETSNIPGHFNMTENDLERPESTLDSASLPQGTFSIFNFTTLIGQPEFNELRQGVYDVHIHLNIDGAGRKPVTITPKLYNISSDGLSRTLLVTFETSDILTVSGSEYDLHGVLTNPAMLADGNRLNLELEATVGATGANPTVTIILEGTTDSHLSIQTSTNAFEKIFIRRDGTNFWTGNENGNQFNTTNWDWGFFNNLNVSGTIIGPGSTFAQYEFANNNFNGSGNFSTEGDGHFAGGVSAFNQELLADPEFDDGSKWDQTDLWTIAGGTATSQPVNGELTEITPFAVVVGQDYIITINYDGGSGGLIVWIGGAFMSVDNSFAGSSQFMLTAINTNEFIVEEMSGSGSVLNSVSVKKTADSIFGGLTAYGPVSFENLSIGVLASDIIPDADGAFDIGTDALRWSMSYFDTVTVGTTIMFSNLITNINGIDFSSTNLTTTGNITAGYFIGDGSLLTNVGGANYQFTDNNFNGTGNFTTIGQAIAYGGIRSVSNEIVEDPEMNDVGGEWDGWTCASGLCNSSAGPPDVITQTNPLIPEAGIDYRIMIDVFAYAFDASQLTISLGGNSVLYTPLKLGKFYINITTSDTTEFSMTKSGAVFSLSGVSIKRNGGESEFNFVRASNINITNGLNVVGTSKFGGNVSLNSLDILQGDLTGNIGSPLSIVGGSVTTSGKAGDIILRTGDSMGSGEGANVLIEAGNVTGGNIAGDIILNPGEGGAVREGAVLISRDKTFTGFGGGNATSVLQIFGNVSINGTLFTFSPSLSNYDRENPLINQLPMSVDILGIDGKLNPTYMLPDEFVTDSWIEEIDGKNVTFYLNKTDTFLIPFNNRIMIDEIVEENQILKNCIANSKDFAELKICSLGVGL